MDTSSSKMKNGSSRDFGLKEGIKDFLNVLRLVRLIEDCIKFIFCLYTDVARNEILRNASESCEN